MRSTSLLMRRVLFAGLAWSAHAHPCDSEHASLCPSAGPEGLGWCLQAADDDKLSAGCSAWLSMNSLCSDDMASKCPGAAWTNDAELCLTKWNRPSDFGEECAAAIPAPVEVEVEKTKKTAEEARKQAARRAARKKAADALRGIDSEPEIIRESTPARSDRPGFKPDSGPSSWLKDPAVQLVAGCAVVALVAWYTGIGLSSIGLGGGKKRKPKSIPSKKR